MNSIENYISKNRQRFIDELTSLLRIPSVSADIAYNQDIINCAQALSELMKNAGMDSVEVMPTKGNPIVYGEKIIDSSLPTILIYGHYDVQPPEPIELWDSPPFEPIIKNTKIHPEGAIFARGSADDKGQFFMHIKAFEAMNATGNLSCNVKVIIEGEEEIGSESLEDFLIEHKEKLKSDIVLISDTEMISKDQPTIAVGLRGISYLQVEITGPDKDLHSGVYGGAVPNPINILTKMIASLHDEDGKITIPDFYNNVKDLSPKEREEIAKLPLTDEEFVSEVGLSAGYGEKGYSSMERTGIRPTLDVNGIWGGYTGEGSKTVIASKAFAKISMRLVPNQTSAEITKLFTDHFRSITPDVVGVKITEYHGGEPYLLPLDHIGYKAAKMALKHTFDKEALPFHGGGSIPIGSLFKEILGLKSVFLGFGLNSDVIHSPNENFGLYNYFKGIETLPYFHKYYTELSE